MPTLYNQWQNMVANKVRYRTNKKIAKKVMAIGKNNAYK